MTNGDIMWLTRIAYILILSLGSYVAYRLVQVVWCTEVDEVGGFARQPLDEMRKTSTWEWLGCPTCPCFCPLGFSQAILNSKSDGRALPLLAERRRLTNKLVTFLVLPRALCSPVSLAVSALIIQPASLPQAHSFHHQTPMLK